MQDPQTIYIMLEIKRVSSWSLTSNSDQTLEYVQKDTNFSYNSRVEMKVMSTIIPNKKQTIQFGNSPKVTIPKKQCVQNQTNANGNTKHNEI